MQYITLLFINNFKKIVLFILFNKNIILEIKL